MTDDPKSQRKSSGEAEPLFGGLALENPLHPFGGSFLTKNAASSSLFIPEDFCTEDILIGKTAEEFLRREVLPHVQRIEKGDHALMHQLMQKAGELGLLAADVPEVYGGLGLAQTTAALIAEKLNFQQSFALTHEAHTVIGTFPLLFFGNHDQKQRYIPKLASGEWIASFALSEVNSGSDALGMQTQAVLSADGSHYVLNGTKMWITNTAFANLFTVFAKVDRQKVTAFLVERNYAGVSFGKEEHKLGMHGTSTRQVILENVQVPLANVLEIGKGHYAAFCALNMGRFKLEAGAVGGLKEVLAICSSYANQRKTFNRPIASYGLIQHKLAEMAARTFALESMVYRLAGYLESVFSTITPDADDAPSRYHHASEEFSIECNIVKVIGSELYSKATDEAIQIHGGYGYTEEFPLARAWRDQRLLRIGEGANEIVRIAIVNTILRRQKARRLNIDFSEAHHEPTNNPSSLFAATYAIKQAALGLLEQANAKYGESLLEEQEVVAAIADLICFVYALESVALRVERLTAKSHPKAETATLMAEICAYGYIEEARGLVRFCNQALETAEGYDENRLCFEANPVLLRRKLATLLAETEGYPLK